MAYDADLSRLVEKSRDVLRVLEQLEDVDLGDDDELAIAVAAARESLEEALEPYGG